jgi:hypothetical protein
MRGCFLDEKTREEARKNPITARSPEFGQALAVTQTPDELAKSGAW